jgi:Asp-tRNA(Asn)/Glu-tRNA(Gln) amidotransferase A subunit family amidase
MTEERLETAAEMAEAVRKRRVSATDLVQRSLERVQQWQESTNAFTQLYFGAAAEEARAIDSLITSGDEVGPLGGVPFAAKELFDVAGKDTTGCCLAYEGNQATRDADVIERMRGAGAILVGKTNQHELAAGATNLVSACGPTFNPWDLGRITGGSSGGSGVAVATGIVPMALGTDTGGSIRIPASFCGVMGLKPTHGAVSLRGVMPLALSMDCPGPMARSLEDLRLAWGAIGQPGLDGGVPKRAGVLGGPFLNRGQPEVRQAVRAVADALQEQGLDTGEVDGTGIDDAPQVWNDYAWSQFAATHGHLLQRRELLDERTASFLEYGVNLPNDRRLAARARAEEIALWFAQRLTEADLLIAPTTPFPAPPVTAERVTMEDGETIGIHGGAVSVLTRPVNLAGLPALALPAGFSGDGLPLGVQLIGGRRREGMLLATAALLERTDERFRSQVPPFPPPGPREGEDELGAGP